jgi:hypothetical protein
MFRQTFLSGMLGRYCGLGQAPTVTFVTGTDVAQCVLQCHLPSEINKAQNKLWNSATNKDNDICIIPQNVVKHVKWQFGYTELHPQVQILGLMSRKI